jgi:cell shape-determining protein MreC
MPQKLSMWKAKHAGCQKAVDDLKTHYEAKVADLEAENTRLRDQLRSPDVRSAE